MRRQGGFTYLGVLLAIAILGIGLSAAAEVWVMTARRQRMEQLEWAGQQYVQAIGSYFEATPGRVKTYPRTLQDLTEDKRFAFVRRHLRQVYVNPSSGVADWEIIPALPDGIRGLRVHVQSQIAAEAVTREFIYAPLNR
jgi:type II secretory pathway pseudopilin PulG